MGLASAGRASGGEQQRHALRSALVDLAQALGRAQRRGHLTLELDALLAAGDPEALLDRTLELLGDERAEGLGLLSRLVCPDVEGFFLPSHEPSRAPVLIARKKALFEASKHRDAKVRAAAWMLLCRVVRAELAPPLTSAFLTEKDKTVRAALYLVASSLAVSGRVVPIDPRADVKQPGLLGWSAALYTVAAERRAHGALGAALLGHLKKPLPLPASWALSSQDEASTTALITGALFEHVEVEEGLLDVLFRGLTGPRAARRIATIAFGALIDRADASGSHTQLAHAPAGLGADRLSPLQREALIALRRLPDWDEPLGGALGLCGADDVEPMLARQGVFAPLDPPLEGFEGASLAWLARRAVLGELPAPSTLLAHLRSQSRAPLLARLPRALLLQQIAAHQDPQACRARDAELFDGLTTD